MLHLKKGLYITNVVHMSKTQLNDIVTKNIRVAMALRGKVTQKELGSALELSKATMSQKFSGKTSWTLADIEKVADYFHVEPARLVGLQGLEPWTDGL